MKKYKLIIFDLDGTLLDSLEGIGAAMNAVLSGHGLPVHTKAEYRYFVGNGLKKLAERALPAEVFVRDGIHPYYEELVKAYETHYKEGLGLYPGIAGLLDRLTEAGYQLAVNSNKIDYMVKRLRPIIWLTGTGRKLAVRPRNCPLSQVQPERKGLWQQPVRHRRKPFMSGIRKWIWQRLKMPELTVPLSVGAFADWRIWRKQERRLPILLTALSS